MRCREKLFERAKKTKKKGTNIERYGKYKSESQWEKQNKKKWEIEWKDSEQKAMTKKILQHTLRWVRKMVIRTSYTITREYRRCRCSLCSKSNQWGSIRAIRHYFDYIKPFLSSLVFSFAHFFLYYTRHFLRTFLVFCFCRLFPFVFVVVVVPSMCCTIVAIIHLYLLL